MSNYQQYRDLTAEVLAILRQLFESLPRVFPFPLLSDPYGRAIGRFSEADGEGRFRAATEEEHRFALKQIERLFGAERVRALAGKAPAERPLRV